MDNSGGRMTIGMGLCGTLTLIFLVLKLFKIIYISWFIVFLPLIIEAVVFFIFLIIFFVWYYCRKDKYDEF